MSFQLVIEHRIKFREKLKEFSKMMIMQNYNHHKNHNLLLTHQFLIQIMSLSQTVVGQHCDSYQPKLITLHILVDTNIFLNQLHHHNLNYYYRNL